jgi:hypothetical protein
MNRADGILQANRGRKPDWHWVTERLDESQLAVLVDGGRLRRFIEHSVD